MVAQKCQGKWWLKNAFLIKECHLVELEGWSGVALNEHVAARGLVLDRAVLLLDLHDPKTKESYRLVCSIGAPLFQSQKKENYLQTTNIYFLSSSNILFAHLGGPGSPMALSGTEGLSNLYIE